MYISSRLLYISKFDFRNPYNTKLGAKLRSDTFMVATVNNTFSEDKDSP
jgi:hypothetical protein